MTANYDKIANIYDALSRVVYGRQIVKAQLSLLQDIPENSRLLLVGGGTGWILEEICRHYSSGLIIDYVESSAKMMALSKKRDPKNNTVNFITQPVEDFICNEQYDAIFTPFVFDNFKPDKTATVFNALHLLLKDKGVWLYADFVYDEKADRLWQKILLKIMYLFFRVTCNIETSELENMDPYFKSGYQKISEQWFYARFIRSVTYQKIQDFTTYSKF